MGSPLVWKACPWFWIGISKHVTTMRSNTFSIDLTFASSLVRSLHGKKYTSERTTVCNPLYTCSLDLRFESKNYFQTLDNTLWPYFFSFRGCVTYKSVSFFSVRTWSQPQSVSWAFVVQHIHSGPEHATIMPLTPAHFSGSVRWIQSSSRASQRPVLTESIKNDILCNTQMGG